MDKQNAITELMLMTKGWLFFWSLRRKFPMDLGDVSAQ